MEDRDKFLTEAMGLRHHEVEYHGMGEWECKTCNEWLGREERYDHHSNPSEWEYFGLLWNWAIEQEWWDGFVRCRVLGKLVECGEDDKGKWNIFPTRDINPDTFANAVYEYLKEKSVA